MPIYEYQCPSPECKKEFELLVKFSQVDDPVECPECKTPEVKRKISRTTFVLEGGGWAKDGYSG